MSSSYIVSGDIHLKIKSGIPLEWQLNRYRLLWQEYLRLCKEHNADLILSGDIFDDHRAGLQEISLFIELCLLMADNNIDVRIIEGNHDYADPKHPTLEFFRPLFDDLNAQCGDGRGAVHYSRQPTLMWDDQVVWHFVGHASLKEERPAPIEGKINILVSHFRADVNAFIREELDVAKLIEPYDACFASDIHMPLVVQGVIYTNHPLNSSFERDPDFCGCLLVTVEGKEVNWKRILLDLPNLVQVDLSPEEYAAGAFEADPKHFYRVTITGTPEEVRALKSGSDNVKLHKVPVVPEAYAEEEEQEEQEDIVETDLETALVRYMNSLKYTEEYISKMMGVFYEQTVAQS